MTMSKQSEAKERQQYTPKLIPGVCGNCAQMTCKKRLPAWMERDKKSWDGKPFTVEEHGVVKDMRCGIGGFAVKKTGSCSEHCFKADKD
jgi:hypothetical protein